MVSQDRRPPRNGALSAIVAVTSLAARIAANDAEPEPDLGNGGVD